MCDLDHAIERTKAEKFNLLDRDGNVLYRVEQKNDGDGVIDNKITYESLTEEQKEEIQRILEKMNPTIVGMKKK